MLKSHCSLEKRCPVPAIDFNALLPNLDSLIRSGQSKIARAKLEEVAKTKLPRSIILSLASLARRAELPLLALRWLNPIVRPSPKAPVSATPEEQAEYAAVLIKIGAHEEGLSLLQKLDDSSLPQVSLFRAFGKIGLWDYQGAIPCLEAYVRHPKADSYQALVAEVNLVASYVYARDFSRAETLLERLLPRTHGEGAFLLYGNLRELKAQCCILQSHWDEAARALEEAHVALAETGQVFEFFVRKWKVIELVLRTKGSSASLA